MCLGEWLADAVFQSHLAVHFQQFVSFKKTRVTCVVPTMNQRVFPKQIRQLRHFVEVHGFMLFDNWE